MTPGSAQDPATTEGRQFFLDWLRIGVFGLLIAYHVGMYYVSWGWHVKSPQASTALEPLMRLSNPWRMGLLFVISGAATGWMLRRGSTGLLRERSARLLLPLLTGMLVIVPPQAYFEAVQKVGYAGSYAAFMVQYLTGGEGLCRDGFCVRVPTWNHLWFLPYLWAYTVVMLLLRRVSSAGWRDQAADWLAARPAWQWWLVPAALLAVLRVTLLSRFPVTNALADDWFNHASYGLLFAIGLVLAARPGVMARFETLRWPALLVALACWAGIDRYVAHVTALAQVPEDLRALARVAFATLQWSAIVAALGFARRHLDRDHPWRAPLTEAVFPVYLVHQTVIVLLAMAFLPWQLDARIEGPLLIVLTLLLCLAFWRLARHAGPLRPWLALPRRSPRAPRPRGAAMPRVERTNQ